MTNVQPGSQTDETAAIARLGSEDPRDIPGIGEDLSETTWERAKRFSHFYLFISPFFILFAILGLYPLIYSLYLSLLEWDGLGPQKWVGLDNYYFLLFKDANFWASLGVTLLLGVMYIPPMFAMALCMALLLNSQVLKLKGFFRAAVFIPCITPMVVIAVVFALLFDGQFGLVNWVWTGLGGTRVEWLATTWGARITVCVVLVWRWTGYNMVLMLAGLQGIGPDLYEAATLDGANKWQQLRHVTIPLLRPTLTFCAVMSLVGTAFMFDEVFVLTNGGPGVDTTNFGLYLFQLSFESFRFGYASAAAYVVAGSVFLLTLVVLRLGKAAD